MNTATNLIVPTTQSKELSFWLVTNNLKIPQNTINNSVTTPLISVYPWCNAEDLVLWWYTIAACNIWSSVSWTWWASFWYYFQWWNNGWTPSWTRTPNTSLINTSWYWPWNYYNNITYIWWAGLVWPYDWTTSRNDNLWWNTTNTKIARQWPCATWYHVPTVWEWKNSVETWAWASCCWWWAWLVEAYKLPLAWERRYSDGLMDFQWLYGRYWSSTPYDSTPWPYMYDAYDLYFSNVGFFPTNGGYRSYAYPVRCFKN
jgi:hypothetical protein